MKKGSSDNPKFDRAEFDRSEEKRKQELRAQRALRTFDQLDNLEQMQAIALEVSSFTEKDCSSNVQRILMFLVDRLQMFEGTYDGHIHAYDEDDYGCNWTENPRTQMDAEDQRQARLSLMSKK